MMKVLSVSALEAYIKKQGDVKEANVETGNSMLEVDYLFHLSEMAFAVELALANHKEF